MPKHTRISNICQLALSTKIMFSYSFTFVTFSILKGKKISFHIPDKYKCFGSNCQAVPAKGKHSLDSKSLNENYQILQKWFIMGTSCASSGWCSIFKYHYNFQSLLLLEKVINADKKAIKEFPGVIEKVRKKKTAYWIRISILMIQHLLYYTHMPWRTYLAKTGKHPPGLKTARDDLTVLSMLMLEARTMSHIYSHLLWWLSF